MDKEGQWEKGKIKRKKKKRKVYSKCHMKERKDIKIMKIQTQTRIKKAYKMMVSEKLTVIFWGSRLGRLIRISC